MYIGGIGGPVLLIVIGAILRWAVTAKASGFDIQLAGLIIFIVGIVGLVLAILLCTLRRTAWYGPPVDGTPHDDIPRKRVTHERVTREYADNDHDY